MSAPERDPREGLKLVVSASPGHPALTPRRRMQIAMGLAVAADAVQMIFFPLFVEGALSALDDVLDAVLAVVFTWLLGWHWEFAPSFLIKLAPGADLAPLWTLAVANVYRKTRQAAQGV